MKKRTTKIWTMAVASLTGVMLATGALAGEYVSPTFHLPTVVEEAVTTDLPAEEIQETEVQQTEEVTPAPTETPAPAEEQGEPEATDVPAVEEQSQPETTDVPAEEEQGQPEATDVPAAEEQGQPEVTDEETSTEPTATPTAKPTETVTTEPEPTPTAEPEETTPVTETDSGLNESETTNEPEPEIKMTDIRAAANGMSDVILQVPEGTPMTILGTEDMWYKVQCQDVIGYVFAGDIEGNEEYHIDFSGVNIYAFSSRKPNMTEGEPVYLTCRVTGVDETQVTLVYQWQVDKHDGKGFVDLPDGTEAIYEFPASIETLSWDWNVLVYASVPTP